MHLCLDFTYFSLTTNLFLFFKVGEGVIMDYTCLASPSFDYIAYMLCSLPYHHHLSLFPVPAKGQGF